MITLVVYYKQVCMILIHFICLQVLLHLYQENRLPIPKACPPLVANIMKECWNKDPGQRPDFKYISAQLSTNIKFL